MSTLLNSIAMLIISPKHISLNEIVKPATDVIYRAKVLEKFFFYISNEVLILGHRTFINN